MTLTEVKTEGGSNRKGGLDLREGLYHIEIQINKEGLDMRTCPDKGGLNHKDHRGGLDPKVDLDQEGGLCRRPQG